MSLYVPDLLRKIIPTGSPLYRLLKRWNAALRYRDFWAYELLPAYADSKADIFFLQVGSNDGLRSDPLNKYIIEKNWRGILVEPVSYIFDKLVLYYAGQLEHIHFENAAIAASSGSRSIYRLTESDDPGLPRWYDQLASFDREVIVSHKKDIPDIENRIIAEEIKCIDFSTLLSKLSVKKIDLLHTDTEGFDAELIRLFPFGKLRPDVVLYEHKHLTRLAEWLTRQRLATLGYEVHYANPSDTLAIQKPVLASLLAGEIKPAVNKWANDGKDKSI